MKRATFKSFVAALIAGTVALVALAQEPSELRAPFWPELKKNTKPTVNEWYSDIPWHQKLASYAANEIMVPIMFPYEVLVTDPKVKSFCDAPGGDSTKKLSEEDCMIEAGVANILAYHRVDTLYDPDDAKIKAAVECQGGNTCTEVKLEISLRRDRSTGSSVELKPEVIGAMNQPPVYGGFVFTDGSTYAPQMLWEMAHYCDSLWNGDMQDPACYGDYFSPFNRGFNLERMAMTDWPKPVPWSVWPMGATVATNYCKPGETACVMALGGFNLSRVPAASGEPADKLPASLLYYKYNDLLMQWFNNALVAFPKELGDAELQNHFPWNGKPVTWKSFIYPLAAQNPFLGTYLPSAKLADAVAWDDCDTGLNGPVTDDPEGHPPAKCTTATRFAANAYVYPRNCTFDDLRNAATGDPASADKLRQCGLNYEVHPNGWLSQWPTTPVDYRSVVNRAPFNYDSNQYGRTSFVFAGIPGMQMPVSFLKDPASGSGMSVYEQVHNASIFSLYLPAANVADVTRAVAGRNYGDTGFYHTLFMSNHMESDPDQFAEGIRGKVLWHNEYRMEPMYDARNAQSWLKDRWFNAAFRPLENNYKETPAPYHNNTCDGCHVRNGSGVPINTEGKLDALMTKTGAYMADKVYVPYANGITKDYTFTGQIRPMKLVFFDLQPGLARLNSSSYSEPLNASRRALAHEPLAVTADDLYYNNKIMNFYGDSFHVSPPGATKDFNFAWHYEPADASRIVVNPLGGRHNAELNKTYQPMQIKLGTFVTPAKNCKLVEPSPTTKPWPKTCADIDDTAIHAAINGSQVGYILLNGKRLGNLGAIEAIPNDAIKDFLASQVASLGDAAGEIRWSAGSRDGVTGKVRKDCRSNTLTDCYIGRFGWLGDRASLEDQVANAAFIEMNMTTKEGYKALYKNTTVTNPIRYAYPNCGAANKTCVGSKGNSDLSERDIKRMADYGRWLGNPTRSEVQVSQPEVIAGEKIFRKLQCDTCHVIKRIDIVPEDTMLNKNFRQRLATHVSGSINPFLSYIGTDLLMHDMGYLSQVGESSQSIRDANGVVKPGFETYVQKVRTPPLKGLRFNNYVTDAHRNTKIPGDPGCDFLLHDGRACSAIEAAFLHDGPAIGKLKVIEGLNALSVDEVVQLRAFLYSL